MEFLKEVGISEDLINSLIKTYDEGVIDVLILEQANVLDVINYFKEINIQVIENLLLYKIELFTKDINIIKEAFNRFDINNLVAEINEDITTIDKV